MTREKPYSDVWPVYELVNDASELRRDPAALGPAFKSIVPPKPTGLMPDKVIVTMVLGTPGAIAVFGDDGIPFTIEPLPRVRNGKLFDRDSCLTQIMHVFPNVNAVSKIVVCLPNNGTGADKLGLRSRSGPGYLIHMLKWLKLPLLVTDGGWRDDVEAHYGKRSIVEILKEHFPSDFRDGYRNEACAQAGILSFLAIANPEWRGLDLDRGPLSPLVTGDGHPVH